MTHEDHPRDDEIAPPTRTRWSEESVPDTDELAPPFAPGDRSPSTGADDDTGTAPQGEAVAGEPDEISIDLLETREEDAADDSESWSPAELYETDEGDDAEAVEPAEDLAEAESAEDLVETEPGGEPSDEEIDPWESQEEVDFATAAVPEAEIAPAVEEGDISDSHGPEEVAALLERMARILRDEGPEAVRKEMTSRDRLASLLAGVVAGYIAGLEEDGS